MAKKIILFLSLLSSDVKLQEYSCPDGTTVDGAQTNVAPVKYLLHRHPDVSEILCIITPEARASAWDHFRDAIRAAKPSLKFTEIDFGDGEDFGTGPLPEVMQKVEQYDEILLETTGGLRDTVMQLLLLSRAMSYSGIKTTAAVYANNSNYSNKKIVDVFSLVGMFDLIGGMQELTSFGSIRTLEVYYSANKHVAEIDRFLQAIKELTDTITLCRTSQVSEKMEKFNEALKDVRKCGDHMICALLPAFKDEFGKNMTIPGLIKWCVKNDMIQQALTIYNEKIPGFILEKAKLFKADKTKKPAPCNCQEYQDEDTCRCYSIFKSIIKDMIRPNKSASINPERYNTYFVNNGYALLCPDRQIEIIASDYLNIRALRNMINHASDIDRQDESIYRYLACKRKVPTDETTVADIKITINSALENLK